MVSKIILLIGAAALVNLTFALECHKCIYIEGDDNNQKCLSDFEEEKETCPTDEDGNEYVCSKFEGVTPDKDRKHVVIRNCDYNRTVIENLFDANCHIGYDKMYDDRTYFGGTLCFCQGDKCNTANTFQQNFLLLILGTMLIIYKIMF